MHFLLKEDCQTVHWTYVYEAFVCVPKHMENSLRLNDLEETPFSQHPWKPLQRQKSSIYRTFGAKRAMRIRIGAYDSVSLFHNFSELSFSQWSSFSKRARN